MLENVLKTALECGCEVKTEASLSEYTTFRTGGKARAVITPENTASLLSVLRSCEENGIKYLVIGNGSNLLVSDNGFNGVVIRLVGKMNRVEYLGDGVIVCDAGASLTSLCVFALKHSLTGLEFAYGIPGSVGGAVFMNAGAYGGEMKDVLYKAEHIRLSDLSLGSFENEKLDFSYRHSAYSDGGYIITKAYFKLTQGNKEEIKSKMDELMQRRTEKQPLEYPSAGSTFKRPEGNFAGALIEKCSLKGYTVGGAQVSTKHAGFVVNIGSATTNDILSVINHVQKTVKEQTGVTLEPEVRIIEE